MYLREADFIRVYAECNFLEQRYAYHVQCIEWLVEVANYSIHPTYQFLLTVFSIFTPLLPISEIFCYGKCNAWNKATSQFIHLALRTHNTTEKCTYFSYLILDKLLDMYAC